MIKIEARNENANVQMGGSSALLIAETLCIYRAIDRAFHSVDAEVAEAYKRMMLDALAAGMLFHEGEEEDQSTVIKSFKKFESKEEANADEGMQQLREITQYLVEGEA